MTSDDDEGLIWMTTDSHGTLTEDATIFRCPLPHLA
jgi:hypothetical protein